MGKRRNKSKKIEFSKTLLIQESILVWITTLTLLLITCYCIFNGFMGTLPWLITLITVVWGAYGVSQVFYYKKSLAENTVGGIKYDTVVKELDAFLNNQLINNKTNADNLEIFNEINNNHFNQNIIVEKPDVIVPEQDHFVEEYIPNLDYGI